MFPLYHVLADAGEFAGGDVVPSTSSNTLRLDGLAMRKDGKTRVLIANLGVTKQTVRVRNLPEHVQVRRLDETNAEEAMLAPEVFRAQEGELLETSAGELELTLLPYAIARIDTAAE